MSVTVNKPLSPAKELFLSIALVAQEISSETIREMKKDFGESIIQNSIIKILSRKGYIHRVGGRTDSGYVLTPEGYEYVRIKLPDRFQYHIHRAPTHIYDKTRRVRYRRMSMDLYNLYREGVAFDDHSTELNTILNGEPIAILSPFFVTQKELVKAQSKLSTTYGTRVYGVIITPSKFIIVYAPSKEKNLYARTEISYYQSLMSTLSSAAAPFHLRENIEYIFLYPNDEDVIDSFVEAGKRNRYVACTYQMYAKSASRRSLLYRMNRSTYHLSDIFTDSRKRTIDAVFMEYYEVKTRSLYHPNDVNICGYYRDTDIPMYMLWDLSPTLLASAIQYTRQPGFDINGKVYIMCFEEEAELIADILKTDRQSTKHFAICELPYNDVIRYINGEIERIE